MSLDCNIHLEVLFILLIRVHINWEQCDSLNIVIPIKLILAI